jgi:ethanolamine permease
VAETKALRKTAGWIHLWALGVGGVISGNYFGWQTGLLAGGFGGLLLATIVIAAMYICLVLSIAELSRRRCLTPAASITSRARRSARIVRF